jgi:hypothetical protein
LASFFPLRHSAVSTRWTKIRFVRYLAMRETDAERFLNHAEQCLKEAEKAISALDKEKWLKFADEWMKLAG